MLILEIERNELAKVLVRINIGTIIIQETENGFDATLLKDDNSMEPFLPEFLPDLGIYVQKGSE